MFLKSLIDRMMELVATETSISGNGLPMMDIDGTFSELIQFT